MKSILNKDFRYTPSASTDISVRFKKMERERKKLLADWDAAIAEDLIRRVVKPRPLSRVA